MATDDKSAALSGDAITATATETKTIAPAGALKSETAPFDLKGLANIEAPKLAAEPPKLADAPKEPLAPPSLIPQALIGRYSPLAASIAIAIGVLGGALGSTALLWSSAPTEVAEAAPMPTNVDETRALEGTLAHLRTDLAALKTSIDASAKGTNGQLARLTERLERAERAQAEPATKINKAIESLERLEKRVDALTARDATGSVPGPQQNAAVNPQLPAQTPTTVIPGWVVRDVYRGNAIVQGRGFGMMEVEAGDTIPGIGRVEAIKRQNGRWVVVTSRGLITSAR